VSDIDHEVPVSSAHLTHILSSLALFEGVPAERLGALAPIFTARTHERGEQLVSAQDPRGRTYLMAAGAARVSRVSPDGRSIAVALIDAGDVVGRLPFDDAAGGERVDALERCTVLRCSVADFEALLISEPTVALRVLGSFSRRIRVGGMRLEGLAFHQVPARLARVLLDLSDRYGKVTATGVRVDVRITHGQLAELVATTRETLTKVAGWLRSENIAALERRQIWIADYAALQEVAEGTRIMPGRAQRASAAAADVDQHAAGVAAKVGNDESVDADDA
jgi:CRP-like cAMP-binding protein